MREALGRLRWQLTLSHLVATAFTLVCLIGAAVLFGTFVAGLARGLDPVAAASVANAAAARRVAGEDS